MPKRSIVCLFFLCVSYVHLGCSCPWCSYPWTPYPLASSWVGQMWDSVSLTTVLAESKFLYLVTAFDKWPFSKVPNPHQFPVILFPLLVQSFDDNNDPHLLNCDTSLALLVPLTLPSSSAECTFIKLSSSNLLNVLFPADWYVAFQQLFLLSTHLDSCLPFCCFLTGLLVWGFLFTYYC